jgi:hypothetical protein
VIDHHHLVTRRGDEHYRVTIVHRREGAVLELTGKDALTVGVGDLLELERPLEGNGMGKAKPKVVRDARHKLHSL